MCCKESLSSHDVCPTRFRFPGACASNMTPPTLCEILYFLADCRNRDIPDLGFILRSLPTENIFILNFQGCASAYSVLHPLSSFHYEV